MERLKNIKVVMISFKEIGSLYSLLSEKWNISSIVLEIIFAIIATVFLIFFLVILSKLFKRLYRLLDSWRGTRIHSIRFQGLELFSATQVTDVLLKLAKLLRAFIVLLILYFYITFVLSLFPWTRQFSLLFLGYIISPFAMAGKAFVNYIPNLITIIVIIFIARYGIKLISIIFTSIEEGKVSIQGFYAEWANTTYKITVFLVIAFVAVVIFPYLPGSESNAFRGVSIFIGVLFSLGSTSIVSNVVAGVVLTYMRAFKMGDRVKIADTMGDIIEKTILVTRVRTIKNVDITIPNSMVLGSHIINYSSSSQESGLILNTTVTIGYDAPWRKVHELLIMAARATENIQDKPAPFILQTSLNDFYVSYELNAYTDKPVLMAKTYSDLHQNIQDKFNEAGVEIMSPHYSSLRDGNTATIPTEYLPKGYKPPLFKVLNEHNKREGQ